MTLTVRTRAATDTDHVRIGGSTVNAGRSARGQSGLVGDRHHGGLAAGFGAQIRSADSGGLRPRSDEAPCVHLMIVAHARRVRISSSISISSMWLPQSLRPTLR